MIENIYSNVAGKEKEYPVSGRRPPKNVRQIGFFTGDFRIYLEDYVHTFTHWLAEQDHTKRCVAVFVGEFAKSEHAREVYAYGTVVAEQACEDGKIEMTAQVWTQIYETIKQYFPDGEIVGWFCGGTSFTEEEKEEIWQIHLDHFAGADRILMLYDFLDREEEFYRYEEDGMVRQNGYYIYYEKNTEMQNYMIDRKQGKGTEENVNDRAVREVRARRNLPEGAAQEESSPTGQSGKAPENAGSRFLYAVGIVMSVVAIVTAASMLYSQERLKGFEQTLNKLIGNVDEDEPAQEASAQANANGENAGGNQANDNSMNWEIPGTGSVTPENENTPLPTPEDAEHSDDPLTDLETTPTIDEKAPSATQAPSEDEKQGGENSEKTGTKNVEEDIEDGKGEKDDNEQPGETDEKTGGSTRTAETGGPGPAIDTSNMQFYVVQPGDTLVGICMKLYGNLDNLEYIKGLNQINNENLIYADQELVVP